jgi:hypothetical protein
MEGHSLHPRRDARGVHWFDSREVEVVLKQRGAGMDVGARSWCAWASHEPAVEKLRRLAMRAVDLLEDREVRALPKPIVVLVDAILR